MESEKFPSTGNPVLDTHLSYITKDIREIKSTLQSAMANFVPITQHLELKTEVDHLKSENEKRKEFQDTLNGKMMTASGLGGLVVGLLMILVDHYL